MFIKHIILMIYDTQFYIYNANQLSVFCISVAIAVGIDNILLSRQLNAWAIRKYYKDLENIVSKSWFS